MREDRVAVRIVIAPQQSVCADEVTSGNTDGIVLERDVEVALPILARLQRDPEGLSTATTYVIPVEPLEHDGRPARLELGNDELQARVALAYTRLDEVGDSEHDASERQRAPGLPEGQTVVWGGAGEDVHGQRHLQGLGGVPKLIVPAVRVQALGRRRGWDAHAHVAQLLGTLHLGDGLIKIIELQAGQREKAVRRLLAVIRGPVIIDGE